MPQVALLWESGSGREQPWEPGHGTVHHSHKGAKRHIFTGGTACAIPAAFSFFCQGHRVGEHDLTM